MGNAASGFEDLWVWDRIGDRMPWYLAVACNRMPAKYLVARRIACEADLRGATEGELWAEHARATERFLAAWTAIRREEAHLADLPPPRVSLLDLSAEISRRILRHCTFCRWRCGVDRVAGAKLGTCQLSDVSRVSSFFHHIGEELVFRGTRGSGTIFFTSCNLRCQFCQNGDISRDKDNGSPVTPEELAAIAWQLRVEGCHNINWVGGEPTMHLHTILAAIRHLASGRPDRKALERVTDVRSDLALYPWRSEEASFHGEFNVPLLWNSNFFMSPEAMRLLRPLMDVWLPDFKYGNDKCAVFLSKTPWYWETVTTNHKLVHDWGEDVVVRHLVVPGHVDCCTKPVLRWIAENTPRVLVNVMDQYHPDSAADPRSPQYDARYAALARRLRREEILEAYAAARELGLCFEDVTYEKTTMRL